jgi:transcriptional regulator with XRE-family HTH domain
MQWNRSTHSVTLANARIAAGWSRKQLAENLGATVEDVIEWESGTSSPDTPMLAAIYAIFSECVGRVPTVPTPSDSDLATIKSPDAASSFFRARVVIDDEAVGWWAVAILFGTCMLPLSVAIIKNLLGAVGSSSDLLFILLSLASVPGCAALAMAQERRLLRTVLHLSWFSLKAGVVVVVLALVAGIGILVLPSITEELRSHLFPQRWEGYAYPSRADLTNSFSVGEYQTLDDCRAACISRLDRANWTESGDFECGLNCRWQGSIRVCQETSK